MYPHDETFYYFLFFYFELGYLFFEVMFLKEFVLVIDLVDVYILGYILDEDFF